MKVVLKAQRERLKSVEIKKEAVDDFDEYLDAYFPQVRHSSPSPLPLITFIPLSTPPPSLSLFAILVRTLRYTSHIFFISSFRRECDLMRP